jgi:hypothetical protein
MSETEIKIYLCLTLRIVNVQSPNSDLSTLLLVGNKVHLWSKRSYVTLESMCRLHMQ